MGVWYSALGDFYNRCVASLSFDRHLRIYAAAFVTTVCGLAKFIGHRFQKFTLFRFLCNHPYHIVLTYKRNCLDHFITSCSCSLERLWMIKTCQGRGVTFLTCSGPPRYRYGFKILKGHIRHINISIERSMNLHLISKVSKLGSRTANQTGEKLLNFSYMHHGWHRA